MIVSTDAYPGSRGSALHHNGDGPLGHLRAVVMLAGGVRSAALMTAAKRSVLDLPISASKTLLDHWLDQVQSVGCALGRAEMPIRVLLDRSGHLPTPHEPRQGVSLSLERDPLDYRGTAGILRDLAVEFADDDLLLIANASQMLLSGLPEILMRMAAMDADVCMVSHDDGTPSGLTLLRCAALRTVPKVGFVDMKEQALPIIAQTHRVRVLRLASASGLSVRTITDYTRALRIHHGGAKLDDADVFAEDWQSSFAIVEPGATVHPTARVHDSVVLEGASVQRGAVLVRCMVGPGVIVKPDSMVVDQVLGARDGVREKAAAK